MRVLRIAKLSKICESAKLGVDFWGDFRQIQLGGAGGGARKFFPVWKELERIGKFLGDLFWLGLEEEGGGEEDGGEGGNAHEQGHEGDGAVTVAGTDSSHAGDDPEVTVVGMRHGHGTCPNGHDHQGGSQWRGVAQTSHHRAGVGIHAHDACRGGDGDRRRPLRRLEHSRDDEGERHAQGRQGAAMLLDDIDKSAVGNDGTQHTAGSGDEDDGSGSHERLLRDVVGLRHHAAPCQQGQAARRRNHQRHKGFAQECQQRRPHACGTGQCHHASHCHEHHRHEDGHEGCQRRNARSLRWATAGLNLSRLNLAPHAPREEVGGNERNERDNHAQGYDQQQIVVDTHQSCRRHRTGRGRDEHMRGEQACRQSQRQRHRRLS